MKSSQHHYWNFTKAFSSLFTAGISRMASQSPTSPASYTPQHPTLDFTPDSEALIYLKFEKISPQSPSNHHPNEELQIATLTFNNLNVTGKQKYFVYDYNIWYKLLGIKLILFLCFCNSKPGNNRRASWFCEACVSCTGSKEQTPVTSCSATYHCSSYGWTTAATTGILCSFKIEFGTVCLET